EAFQQGLSQLGYTEGQQVAFVDLHTDGVPSRLPSIAAELVRTRPDVIFARGPAAVAAAAGATKTIPSVAADLESDPIALGYAKTLARPGGNVTGVFLDLPELSAKHTPSPCAARSAARNCAALPVRSPRRARRDRPGMTSWVS